MGRQSIGDSFLNDETLRVQVQLNGWEEEGKHSTGALFLENWFAAKWVTVWKNLQL